MRQKIFALLCALVLAVGAVPTAAALEGEALRAADTLATLDLVQGTGHGGYALDAPATRAQAAVLLVRLAGAEQAAKDDLWISGFRDVPAWAHTEITYAAHQNWITGVTQLDFQPNAAITADQWFAFLLRMLGYSDPADGAAVFAQRIGLTPRAYSGSLTRRALFQSAADALPFSYKDGSATVAERLAARDARSQAAAGALGLLDEALTARQIADRHSAAVFLLTTYDTQEGIDNNEPYGEASGFFITADGLAVTNYHSIEDAIHATATLSTGEVCNVERVLYYDPDIDIAVIRIAQTSAAGQSIPAFATMELAGVEDVRPGDQVYALGNPLGLCLSVSSGIVSAVDHQVERYALPCLVNTADISQGSSGGALMNIYGQVVAVTTGAYTYGNSMYLAVPVDPVMDADLSGEGLTLKEVVQAEQAKNAD